MKRILLIALCLSVLAGCRKEGVREVAIEIVYADSEFPAKGGRGTIQFLLSGDPEGKVTAVSSGEWLTILDVTDSEVSFVLAPNRETAARNADITLTAGNDSKKVGISQGIHSFDLEGGDSNSLVMDPTGQRTTALTYNVSGGVPDVGISYGEGGDADWLEVTVFDGRIGFAAEPNFTDAGRSATIILSSEWISYEVAVYQDFVTTFLSCSSFGCDKGAYVSEPVTIADYAVGCVGNWSCESDSDWYSVEITGDSFVISVPENATGTDRRGNIFVKNSAGTVISAIPVVQTCFTSRDLSGHYVMQFGDGDYWLMDLVEEGNGFAVKAIGSSANLKKTDGYSLRLDYVPAGEGAPKMTLKLPQMLGTLEGQRMMLYAIDPEGYYSVTENLGYELLYKGTADKLCFDFVTEEDAYWKGFQDGFSGLFLMRGTLVEDWMEPSGGKESLQIVKWGEGSHNGFN